MRPTKHTLEEIKSQLAIKNPMIEITSEYYTSSKKPLSLICLVEGCNHKWNATWNNLVSRKCGCPNCHGLARMTLEKCKIELFKINPFIQIISTEYVNTRTKLECKCLVTIEVIGL